MESGINYTQNTLKTITRKKTSPWLVFLRQWQLYAMILLPVVYILIFAYGPMCHRRCI